jgi:hypothetical protein
MGACHRRLCGVSTDKGPQAIRTPPRLHPPTLHTPPGLRHLALLVTLISAVQAR